MIGAAGVVASYAAPAWSSWTIPWMLPPLFLAGPIAVLSLPPLVLSFRRRSPAMGLLGLALLAVCVWISGFEAPQWGRPEGKALRVMTFNVHFDSREMPDLLEYIRREKLEVVMLQEDRGAGKYLAANLPGWSHVQSTSHSILSRHPIARHGDTPLVTLGFRRILWADVSVDDRIVRVVTTHLRAPHLMKGPDMWRRETAAKRQELREILDVVGATIGPVILGADFNNPPGHPFSRKLGERLENCFGRAGVGPGWTYPSRLPIIRIDHLYVGGGLATSAAWVGPNLGSDHRPVAAEVVLGR